MNRCETCDTGIPLYHFVCLDCFKKEKKLERDSSGWKRSRRKRRRRKKREERKEEMDVVGLFKSETKSRKVTIASNVAEPQTIVRKVYKVRKVRKKRKRKKKEESSCVDCMASSKNVEDRDSTDEREKQQHREIEVAAE